MARLSHGELSGPQRSVPLPDAVAWISLTRKFPGESPGPIGPSPSKFAHLFDETTQAEIGLELETGFFEEVEERLSGTPGRIWVSGAES